MPDGIFCFTLHPSSVNEGADDVQRKKRAVFLHECKVLSARVHIIKDPSKKLEDALEAGWIGSYPIQPDRKRLQLPRV